MKRLITLILIFLPCCLAMGQDVSLNGEWQFWIPEKKTQPPQTVVVPHTYNIMEGLEDYAGRACYSRELPVKPDMKGKSIRLCFNGIYHDAVIFVNGQKAGEHLNAGYTPFSIDITPFLDFSGARNTLEVHTDNSYSDDNLPWCRKFDWAADGGIYRDVWLHVSGRQTLRYVHVTPAINLQDSTATAHFDVRLWQTDIKKTTLALSITENKTGRKVYEGRQTLKQQKDGTFKCDIDCGKVLLWHFDNPNLYTFRAKVFDGKTLSDAKTERFGFRTFRIEGDHFTLNGEPVRLPGIEDMPGSNPLYGMAEPKEYMERSVRMMKDLNCTLTRFHWAQDDYRLQLMDSLGILAQEEISWWQGPHTKLNNRQRAVALQQISELIEAHYNHPCIWAWGMSNEVGDNRADLKVMAEHARSLDSTRIIDAVCNHLWREKENDPSLSLDLPTWNEYIGTWHAKHRDQLPGFFADVEKVLNGRPVLIAEHGLCEPAFTGGDARRVDEMIYHIGEWKKHPFVCGYIYFCLQDYRTQMGEEGYGRNRIRRHGVTTKDLTPKASYYILRQMMNPIDITAVKPANAKKNEGTLANLYNVDSSNRSAEVTLQVKNDIPTYILRGYRLEYLDAAGQTVIINLPDMHPGQDYTFTMQDINPTYTFAIKRSDGTTVIEY